MFFIDLAVPRDVSPRIEELDGTFLYNIDDFSRLVAESMSSRQKEAESAEQLVLREVETFERWAESEQATPTIVALRRRMRGVLEAELERTSGQTEAPRRGGARGAERCGCRGNKLLHGHQAPGDLATSTGES